MYSRCPEIEYVKSFYKNRPISQPVEDIELFDNPSLLILQEEKIHFVENYTKVYQYSNFKNEIIGIRTGCEFYNIEDVFIMDKRYSDISGYCHIMPFFNSLDIIAIDEEQKKQNEERITKYNLFKEIVEK